MIRIAMIAHLSELSGAGTALVEKAAHLDTSKFQVILVLPGDGPLWEFAKQRNLNVCIVPNSESSIGDSHWARKINLLTGRLRYIADLRRFLKNERIQVAFVNSTASVFAGIAGRLARIPVFWMVHEVLDTPSQATRLKMRIVKLLSNAMAWDSNLGKALFPPPPGIPHIVFPNYVDTNRFRYRVKTLSPDKTRTVLCNGPFPRKGADVFLKAARIVAASTAIPCRFVIVGPELPAHSAFCEALHQTADSPELSGKVEFMGIRKDIPQLLADADVFVSASRNEAWPIIVLEAMASGTPVVCTSVGDCHIITGTDNERGLLVPSNDPETMAQAIVRCLEHPEDATRRAETAYDWVSRTCSGPDYWRPLEDLLEKIASR